MVLQVSKKKLFLLKAMIALCAVLWCVGILLTFLLVQIKWGLILIGCSVLSLCGGALLWDKMCRCPQCGKFLKHPGVSKLYQMAVPENLPETCCNCKTPIQVELVK